MNAKTTNKKRKRFSWFRLLGVLVAVLLLVKLCQQYQSYLSMLDQLEQYEEELALAESEYQAVLDKKELLYNDSYVERLARENLGMVKPGEIRVSTVKVEDIVMDGGKEEDETTEESMGSQPNDAE